MFQSKADVVERMFSALEGGFIREAGRFITDDFTCSGLVPHVTGKQEFLEIHQALIDAFLDWSYNIGNIREQGDAVVFDVHIDGTNTGDLRMPQFGVDDMKATGRHVSVPRETVRAKVHDTAVAELVIEGAAGGSLSAVLAQLGVLQPETAGV